MRISNYKQHRCECIPLYYIRVNKTIVLFTKYVKNCRKIFFFLSNSNCSERWSVYVYANNFKSVLVRLNARTPWKKNCSCTIINQRNFRTISIRKNLRFVRYAVSWYERFKYAELTVLYSYTRSPLHVAFFFPV